MFTTTAVSAKCRAPSAPAMSIGVIHKGSAVR